MAKIINGIIYSNDMKTVIEADSDITSALIEDGVKAIIRLVRIPRPRAFPIRCDLRRHEGHQVRRV